MSKLRRNAVLCLHCKDVIESKHRHDLQHCRCGAVFVDGGLDYLRRGWSGGEAEDHFVEMVEYEGDGY